VTWTPEKNRAGVRRTYRKKRAFILAYKAARGCEECGERDVRVLDLDHIDPKKKTRNWGRGTSWMRLGWKAIEEELRLCQVLCANCHRRKTWTDMNWTA